MDNTIHRPCLGTAAVPCPRKAEFGFHTTTYYCKNCYANIKDREHSEQLRMRPTRYTARDIAELFDIAIHYASSAVKHGDIDTQVDEDGHLLVIMPGDSVWRFKGERIE